MSDEKVDDLADLDANPDIELKGILGDSLKRSSKEIREERGRTLFEDLYLEYNRTIEDLEREIKRKQSEQNREFDFSPGTSISLSFSKDFDPRTIMEQDKNRSLEINNLRIKRNLLAKRANALFGEDYKMVEVV